MSFLIVKIKIKIWFQLIRRKMIFFFKAMNRNSHLCLNFSGDFRFIISEIRKNKKKVFFFKKEST